MKGKDSIVLKMMTRSRAKTLIKSPLKLQEMDENIKPTAQLERNKFSEKDLSEPTVADNFNDGCQSKQEKAEDQCDNCTILLQAVLGMSTELRQLTNKVNDIEEVLHGWMGHQTNIFQRMADHLEERSTDESIIMKSRGNQCPSPSPTIEQDSMPTYAEKTRSLSPSNQKIRPDEEKTPGTNSSVADESKAKQLIREEDQKQANQRRESMQIPLANQEAAKKEVKPRASNSDVKLSQEEEAKEKRDENKEHKTLDDKQVLILSDSILNGVNDNRLGNSYDFDCKIRKCYTTSEIEQSFKDEVKDNQEKPKITVLHVGVNDLKNNTPQVASKTLINAVKAVQKTCPQTKIVISSVAPVKRNDLDLKREAFNAINRAELACDKSISFLSHDNLDAMSWRYMHKDGIHPTRDGSSILARNLGRHICSVFWKVVSYKSRRPLYNHQYSQNQNRPNMYDRGFDGYRYVGGAPISTKNRFSALNQRS